MFNARTERRIGRTRARRTVDFDTRHDDVDPIIDEVCRRHSRYWIKVQLNVHGLYRITLADRNQVIPQRPGLPGYLVRELYTYKQFRMLKEANCLLRHVDPPAYCSSLITAWNCDQSDGPISLDSTPMSRVALVPNQPPLETV